MWDKMTCIFITLLLISSADVFGLNPTDEELNALNWDKLSAMKCFFGHQSVGRNIIEGMNHLLPDGMEIREKAGNDSSFPDGAFLFHANIGVNTRPETKISDFQSILDTGLGSEIDYVFMKFCYVDITAQTDVEELFKDYKKSISMLQEKYPPVAFIHFTAPLTFQDGSFKAAVKKALGKKSWGIKENINRQKYNELIRKEYGADGTVFDLALFESTNPDGSRVMHNNGGEFYYSLSEKYSEDGGHLNSPGQKYIAYELLKFLENL